MEPVLDWDVVVVGGINAAVAAAPLGARTAIIGRVGHDERGRTSLESLADEGVSTRTR